MARRLSHLGGCVGFWLWALVGAAGVLGFISFGWLVLLPALGLGYLLQRREGWKEGPVLFGLITGAGLPLPAVAALNWNDWHQRITGDGTPNPYGWGAVGLVLINVGVGAYSLKRPRA